MTHKLKRCDCTICHGTGNDYGRCGLCRGSGKILDYETGYMDMIAIVHDLQKKDTPELKLLQEHQTELTEYLKITHPEEFI